MTFGSVGTFAIEAGELVQFKSIQGYYIQFRFWVDNSPFGDWDDRIPLVPSIKYTQEFCENSKKRFNDACLNLSSSDLVHQLRDAFYSYDYKSGSSYVSDLRCIHHLDDVGMGAVVDRYGIVVVSFSCEIDRIVVKNLENNIIEKDISLAHGVIDSACTEYISWGRSKLGWGDNIG